MRKLLFLLTTLSLGFLSCSKNDSVNNTSRMVVRMGDAPGDYEKVIVDVQDVMISYSDDENGWISLPNVRRGEYDLIKLTAGLDTLLVDGNVGSGKLKQIRLLLGPNNTVTVDGVTSVLETPSAQQSGLKIKLNSDLLPGITYRVLLDFDVSKSIVETGSNKYILKPVIRAIVDAAGGSIKGSVSPVGSGNEVLAITGVDTVSAFTSADGDFLVQGLVSGNYRVVVNPFSSSGFSSVTRENVVVTQGVVTDLGIIVVQP